MVAQLGENLKVSKQYKIWIFLNFFNISIVTASLKHEVISNALKLKGNLLYPQDSGSTNGLFLTKKE